MSASATAVSKLVALAIAVAESASTEQMLLSPFGEGSIARVEEVDIGAADITDNDVTSMVTVRELLDSYRRSATAHIRAAAVLMGSDRSATPLLSIAALSRISCEASGIAFWLSDPKLPWNERLKRCNQLQFKMFAEALRPSKQFAKVLSTSLIAKNIVEYRDAKINVIDFAKRRDWDYHGQSPSNSNWSKAIPSFTQIMRDLLIYSGQPAAAGQMLYSVGSGAVHSNPLLVDRALGRLEPVAEQYSAALKIKHALWCHHLLEGQITKWTDWNNEVGWLDELEQISQTLLNLYQQETQCSPGSTEERQEYRQYFSEVFELMRDGNDEDTQ